MFHRLFDDPGQFLLLGLVVGGVMVWALSYRQRIGDARTARVAAMVILVLWLGFVVLANLIGPTNLAPDIPRSSFNLVPFSSFLHSGFPGRETQEVVGNLALFAPLGAFLPFVSSTFNALWRVCLIAFLFASALELAQYVVNLGRVADIDDAILNSAGALVGWLAWRSLAPFRARA